MQAAQRALLAAAQWLWQRLLPLLRKLQEAAEADPSAPDPNEVLEHRENSGPIVVPAQGHVFTFTVRAVLTWSAKGEPPERLIWGARNFMPRAIQQLRRTAVECARGVPPHRADDLEVALQAALDKQDRALWRFTRGDVTVDCHPEVSVRHDERVQAVLRPYWDKLVELEARYELHRKRAEHAEELTRRWVTILDEMGDDRAGEEAAAVTEELAEARKHMAAQQRAAAQWSAELLRERQHLRQIFEPFTVIDLIPQQAPGPDARQAPGPDGDAPAQQASSPDAPGDAPQAEGIPPAPGQDDKR